MFYLGPAGLPTSAKNIEEGLKVIANLELNALEVQFVRGVKMSPNSAKKVCEAAKKLNIKLSAHAPYFINLNSPKKNTVKNSIRNIIQTAYTASILNAEMVTVHAGYYSGKSSENATEVIKGNIAECVEKIAAQNWNVCIGLETMGKRSSWGTLDEILTICKDVKNVLPVVDFAHIHARNNGSLKTEEAYEKVLQEYEKTNAKFLHAHFTCVQYSEKGERKHLTMEESKEPDFRILAKVLKKKKYDVTIISESPILEQDSLRMKKILAEC